MNWNCLYYVEHYAFLTKIGLHHKGFYAAEEVLEMLASGEHIYRLSKVTATCKGKKVEIRRKSRFPRTRSGKYGVGVESVE